MTSLELPEHGILLQSPQVDPVKLRAAPRAIAVTLTDTMIEDMIRCVQKKRPIHLSLGQEPKITLGAQSQRLSTSHDPFTHELYRTTYTTPPNTTQHTGNMVNTGNKVPVAPKVNTTWLASMGCSKMEIAKIQKDHAAKIAAETAGVDVALTALQNSLASEQARKQEKSTQMIQSGPAKGSIKSRLLPQTSRSISSSPAMISAHSPGMGPKPVPLSQQQAEHAKIARKPIVHLLALSPTTEKALREAVNMTNQEVKQALNKAAEINESTGKWELRQNYWKELDVWSYDFPKPGDREKTIENAVKQFDKMRMGLKEQEWDRLLPKEERGRGKCLSKLQASIASGDFQQRAAKRPAEKESKNTGDTDKVLNKAKGPTRPTIKSMSSKAAAALGKKQLSKELVSESDEDEEAQPPSKSTVPDAARSKPTKRSLEDMETSDSPAPLSKKVKRDAPSSKHNLDAQVSKPTKKTVHDDIPSTKNSLQPSKKDAQCTTRTPVSNLPSKPTKRRHEEDASSDNGSVSKKIRKDPLPTRRDTFSSSASSTKTKDNSPHKSSPLASSPPTNASEIDTHSSSDRTSISGSPNHPLKTNRHHKSSSTASSVSTTETASYLKPEILDVAQQFRLFYKKYEQLYREIQRSGRKDAEELKSVWKMHERLVVMKQQIMRGIVSEG